MIEVARIGRATTILFGAAPTPEIGSEAYRRELKAAFRRRVLETHPDRARVLGRPESLLRAEFHAVAEAYQLLSGLRQPVAPRPPPRAAPARRPSPPPPPRRPAPEPAQPRVHFHRGPVPATRMRLAEFLYYSGRIPWNLLVESVAWQRAQRPAIGRIAVGWGQLTEADVREVLESRRRDRAFAVPFGEQALRLGLLTPFQLLALLGRQRRMQRKIGEFFVERGVLRAEEIPAIRLAVVRHNARCRA